MSQKTEEQTRDSHELTTTEEQAQDSRELTTEELEAVAGGWSPGIMHVVVSAHVRQNPKLKCKIDPLACQY
jgi:hypothetical protein